MLAAFAFRGERHRIARMASQVRVWDFLAGTKTINLAWPSA